MYLIINDPYRLAKRNDYDSFNIIFLQSQLVFMYKTNVGTFDDIIVFTIDVIHIIMYEQNKN